MAQNEYLRFQRERENKYDPYAILVKLKDGRTIGRVPANLCRLLVKLKEAKIITSLKCKYTGTCRRSTEPHYLQSFQSGHSMDKNGGGVVLTADYEVTCPRDKYEKFKIMCQEHIPNSELSRFCV